jgi:acetyl-CoA carboxylase biotin carboxyl carrier protein
MDLRQIKNLIKEFEDSEVFKMEITEGDLTIKLEKAPEVKSVVSEQLFVQPTNVQATPQMTSPIQEKTEAHYHPVKSPLVGTFYAAPSPDSEPFVGVGDQVKKGDVLFIVEAMKVMNEVVSPQSGKIVKILVDNGQTVEYGQTILEIE